MRKRRIIVARVYLARDPIGKRKRRCIPVCRRPRGRSLTRRVTCFLSPVVAQRGDEAHVNLESDRREIEREKN